MRAAKKVYPGAEVLEETAHLVRIRFDGREFWIRRTESKATVRFEDTEDTAASNELEELEESEESLRERARDYDECLELDEPAECSEPGECDAPEDEEGKSEIEMQ